MKEIKEILEDLRKTADNSIFVVCGSQEELDKAPKYTANFLTINDREAKTLLELIDKKEKEIERLNNIINTLEELIGIKLQRDYHEPDYKINIGDLEEIYDKLQELKGSDKE